MNLYSTIYPSIYAGQSFFPSSYPYRAFYGQMPWINSSYPGMARYGMPSFNGYSDLFNGLFFQGPVTYLPTRYVDIASAANGTISDPSIYRQQYAQQQANAYSIQESIREPEPSTAPAHPILLDVRQVSPNQIELDYDVPTDKAAALNVRNYWIRNNQSQTDGVASMSQNDRVLLPGNSLTPEMAHIESLDDSNTKYALTFKRKMVPGVQYTVLPCNISIKGQNDYKGQNWSPESENVFVAE
ncbi:hypothetical protein [Bacillus sp. 1P06AnD]|uniref:hypothetical protein n=1 Tax=Bacillus sp. 1P06AnD TaxID=3132208 RepID=UPI0039A17360